MKPNRFKNDGLAEILQMRTTVEKLVKDQKMMEEEF